MSITSGQYRGTEVRRDKLVEGMPIAGKVCGEETSKRSACDACIHAFIRSLEAPVNFSVRSTIVRSCVLKLNTVVLMVEKRIEKWCRSDRVRTHAQEGPSALPGQPH